MSGRKGVIVFGYVSVLLSKSFSAVYGLNDGASLASS